MRDAIKLINEDADVLIVSNGRLEAHIDKNTGLLRHLRTGAGADTIQSHRLAFNGIDPLPRPDLDIEPHSFYTRVTFTSRPTPLVRLRITYEVTLSPFLHQQIAVRGRAGVPVPVDSLGWKLERADGGAPLSAFATAHDHISQLPEPLGGRKKHLDAHRCQSDIVLDGVTFTRDIVRDGRTAAGHRCRLMAGWGILSNVALLVGDAGVALAGSDLFDEWRHSAFYPEYGLFTRHKRKGKRKGYKEASFANWDDYEELARAVPLTRKYRKAPSTTEWLEEDAVIRIGMHMVERINYDDGWPLGFRPNDGFKRGERYTAHARAFPALAYLWTYLTTEALFPESPDVVPGAMPQPKPIAEEEEEEKKAAPNDLELDGGLLPQPWDHDADHDGKVVFHALMRMLPYYGRSLPPAVINFYDLANPAIAALGEAVATLVEVLPGFEELGEQAAEYFASPMVKPFPYLAYANATKELNTGQIRLRVLNSHTDALHFAWFMGRACRMCGLANEAGQWEAIVHFYHPGGKRLYRQCYPMRTEKKTYWGVVGYAPRSLRKSFEYNSRSHRGIAAGFLEAEEYDPDFICAVRRAHRDENPDFAWRLVRVCPLALGVYKAPGADITISHRAGCAGPDEMTRCAMRLVAGRVAEVHDRERCIVEGGGPHHRQMHKIIFTNQIFRWLWIPDFWEEMDVDDLPPELQYRVFPEELFPDAKWAAFRSGSRIEFLCNHSGGKLTVRYHLGENGEGRRVRESFNDDLGVVVPMLKGTSLYREDAADAPGGDPVEDEPGWMKYEVRTQIRARRIIRLTLDR
jgi:hypothetical protein